MTTRNLIVHKMAMPGGNLNPQSIFTTARFVRVLLSCIVLGIWPLLGTLTSTFLRSRTSDPVPSWLGWTTVHKHFGEIPAIPLSSLTDADLRGFVRRACYNVLSSSLIAGFLIGTEDVRGDFSRFWGFLAYKISCMRRCDAVPPSRSPHEAPTSSSRVSPNFMLTALVPTSVSEMKAQFVMLSRPAEPIPHPDDVRHPM